MERVVSTVTTITTAKPGDSFQSVDSEGTRNLIDAAAAAGAKHFVFISFDSSGMRDAPLAAAKRDVENHLRQSGLTFTILQPSLFMESWLGPMLFADPAASTARVYGPGDQPIGYVAVSDCTATSTTSATAT